MFADTIKKEQNFSKMEKLVSEREKLIDKYEKRFGSWKPFISGNYCYVCGSSEHTERSCLKLHKRHTLKCSICESTGHVASGCLMTSDVAPLKITVPLEKFEHLGEVVVKTGERMVRWVDSKVMKTT